MAIEKLKDRNKYKKWIPLIKKVSDVLGRDTYFLDSDSIWHETANSTYIAFIAFAEKDTFFGLKNSRLDCFLDIDGNFFMKGYAIEDEAIIDDIYILMRRRAITTIDEFADFCKKKKYLYMNISTAN